MHACICNYLLIFIIFIKVSVEVDYPESPHAILRRINRRLSTIGKREVLDQCDDEKLMIYLAEVQVTNPESIINLSTQDDLSIVCKQVAGGLLEIESYLKSCILPTDRDLYLQLIKGVAEFVDVMCERETSIKKSFMQHISCLRQLHTDFENCHGPADWTEDIKKHDMCCAYKQIVDCYFIKAAEVCGKKAAHAMKKVVMNIVNVVIPSHCIIMFDPVVKHAAPDEAPVTCPILKSWLVVSIIYIAVLKFSVQLYL